LAAGLIAVGLDSTTAISAALLYRIATFWLPILPGWASFWWLQRKHAL
jgi:undecaprenyl-diphosphatase